MSNNIWFNDKSTLTAVTKNIYFFNIFKERSQSSTYVNPNACKYLSVNHLCTFMRYGNLIRDTPSINVAMVTSLWVRTDTHTQNNRRAMLSWLQCSYKVFVCAAQAHKHVQSLIEWVNESEQSINNIIDTHI